MTWFLVGCAVWVAVAVPVALVIGRSIRLADRRSYAPPAEPPAELRTPETRN